MIDNYTCIAVDDTGTALSKFWDLLASVSLSVSYLVMPNDQKVSTYLRCYCMYL